MTTREGAGTEETGRQAARLDGKKAAEAVRERVGVRVEALRRRGVRPGFAVVQVGQVPASDVYVRNKLTAAEALGFRARHERVAESDGPGRLFQVIEELNRDPGTHGFLVQAPLPAGWDAGAAFRAVSPEKDLDGFHPLNVGLTTLGEGGFWPCTALGVVELLHFHGLSPAGWHAVVVGRSRVVGRPLASLLSQKQLNATVTLCHTGSGDVARYTRVADLVVMAAGTPRSLTGDMIRPGAVVVDVGIHSLPDPARPGKTRLVGDVDAASVSPIAGWLSPVPGGVGPMTVAMLLQNAVTACEWQTGP